MASRICVSAAADLLGAADRLAVAGDQHLGLERDHPIDGVDVARWRCGTCRRAACTGSARGRTAGRMRLPVNTVRSSGSHTTSESVVSPPGVEYSSKRRPPSVNAWLSRKVVVTTGSGGWYERSTLVMSRPQSFPVRRGVERLQPPPVLAHVGVVRLGDRLDARRVELRPTADVVGVALGEHDHPQRVAAHLARSGA